MAEYLLFMHDDAAAGDHDAWESYLATLRGHGVFQGGSAVGGGLCVRKDGATPPTTAHLAGSIRVTAATIDDARSLVAGIRTSEAGGTVEIRELPRI